MSTTDTTDRGPPRDDEAEAAVLASIMFDPRCLPAVSRIVRPESFGAPVNQKIFAAMLRLSAAGTPIDTTLLIGELRDHGDYDGVGDGRRDQVIEADLIDLSRLVPSAVHHAYYARRVAEVARRRRAMLQALDTIASVQRAGDDVRPASAIDRATRHAVEHRLRQARRGVRR